VSLIVPPSGVTPLSFFEDSPTDELPAAPVIRAERIDHPSGELGSVVRDRHPIDAQVFEALTIVRDTGAAVQGEGQRFSDVEKIDASAPSLLESEARFALRRLVEQGDVSIEDVSVTEGTDWSEVSVSYRNLRDPDGSELRKAAVRMTKGG